jgi:hypothetical protein
VWTRSVTRKDAGTTALQSRLAELTTGFAGFVAAYDRAPPFRRAGQLEHHRATIDLRRRLGSIGAAIESREFVEVLRRTLYAWGIGKRRSRLHSVEQIHRALRERLRDLEALEGLALETMSGPEVPLIAARLHTLVTTLDIVDNEARIVAGTKTLHHILPDLVPPMDRAWTAAFFQWSTIDAQYRQEKTFSRTYLALAAVARATKPSQYVGPMWRTSGTKVLDNAVVGYCLERGLGVAGRRQLDERAR